MVQTTLTIGGMSCVHCRRAVFTALAGVQGVTSAEVAIGRAVIEHEPAVTREALAAAISEAGYTVTDAVSNSRILPQVR